MQASCTKKTIDHTPPAQKDRPDESYSERHGMFPREFRAEKEVGSAGELHEEEKVVDHYGLPGRSI